MGLSQSRSRMASARGEGDMVRSSLGVHDIVRIELYRSGIEVHPVETRDRPAGPARKKGYRGMPMEGLVARWYAGLRRSGSQIEDWRAQAARLTRGLADGADVLEVAPGP